MIKRIALIMAMREEAKPLISLFNLVPDEEVFDTQLPMEVYRGKLEDTELYLVLNGKDPMYGVELIGTQSASITTLSILQHIKPDLLINAGTAGGFESRGAKIGQVYSAISGVCFHDRRVPLGGPYEKQGIGYFPCHEIPKTSEALGLKQGRVTTGSSLDYTELDKKNVDTYNGELKDMEAAAIAMVCNYYKQPLVIIKSVTDIVDGPHPTHEEFTRNLDMAANNLAEKCEALIRFCSNKDMSSIN